MKKGSSSFTLIEIMLAVAIFAFAVVGFSVALTDVLGVNAEILRTAQRRQAAESAVAQILAVSNNLAERDWKQIPGWESEQAWTLHSRVKEAKVSVPGPNNTTLEMFGWFWVDVESRDNRETPVDRVAVLLWGQR